MSASCLLLVKQGRPASLAENFNLARILPRDKSHIWHLTILLRTKTPYLFFSAL
ncbi:17990_t:CDS:1, partial [Funneliformis geosporum]